MVCRSVIFVYNYIFDILGTYTFASHKGDISIATSVVWPGNLGNTDITLSKIDSKEWLVTPHRSNVRSHSIKDAGFEQF